MYKKLKTMENKKLIIEEYLRKLISEVLTKKSRDSFVNQVLRLAKQIGVTGNSNLIILRDVLLVLIPKLATEHPYSKIEKDKLIRTINQIFIGNVEQPGETLPLKWDDPSKMVSELKTEFPNGLQGLIIQDYAGYKYKVWKYNQAVLYMICQSLDDGKVYWVDTEEMMKGFSKA